MKKVIYLDEVYPMEEAQSTDQNATTQDASQTTQSTDQTTTTQSTDTQALPQLTWVTLGSKTYSVSVEVPACGISVTNIGYHLYRNGSEISSGATVYTTDTLSAKITYTVGPACSGAGYGIVQIAVYVDGSLKGTNQKSYTELTSSKGDSINYTIGKLSAGNHTIKIEAKKADNPPA